MKCVNKKWAAGRILPSQILTEAAFAAPDNLAGTADEFAIAMQELNHEFH
jgi:hypothetical protein